jgi:hypothetical protein
MNNALTAGGHCQADGDCAAAHAGNEGERDDCEHYRIPLFERGSDYTPCAARALMTYQLFSNVDLRSIIAIAAETRRIRADAGSVAARHSVAWRERDASLARTGEAASTGGAASLNTDQLI